jgi:hypothetical protein
MLTERSTGARRLKPDSALAELTALAAFAVAQPVFDLLGRAAPFFLHHRADTIDAWFLALVLAAGLPLLLWLAVTGAGSVASIAGERIHALLRAVLVALLVLTTLRTLGSPLPGLAALAAAAVLGGLAARALARSPGLRFYLAVIALAAPVFAGGFLVSPAVRGLVPADEEEVRVLFPDAQSDPQPPSDVPVVLVVFDEFPLLSILDADLGIDGEAFPRFAELAATATWYRNASTVWNDTVQSLTSILTGNVADEDVTPTLREVPGNLLSWLGQTHDVRAQEVITAFALPSPSPPPAPGERPARLGRIFRDAAVVYLHLATPADLAGRWPGIDGRWGNFQAGDPPRRGAATDGRSGFKVWDFALADPRGRQFEEFLQTVERPAPGRAPFYFIHSMLPHTPQRFLPSGKVYGGRPVFRAMTDLVRHPWFLVERYQRHLFQVGYTDRLLGDLMARLKAVGLFDQALVIVTSDHGSNFWPGENSRKGSHLDDVLRVPLLVKEPFQHDGAVSDRNVQTIDIVPTVAEILGRDVPWPVTGRSVLSGEPAAGKVLRTLDGSTYELDGAFRVDEASLGRKLMLFDPAHGIYRFVRFGPYRDLIGVRLADLADVTAAECSLAVDQLPLLRAYDPGDLYAPANLTGELLCPALVEDGAFVAIALHGTIAATVPLVADEGRRTFSAFVPEAALTAGANAPAALVVDGPPEKPRLRSVTLVAPDD